VVDSIDLNSEKLFAHGPCQTLAEVVHIELNVHPKQKFVDVVMSSSALVLGLEQIIWGMTVLYSDFHRVEVLLQKVRNLFMSVVFAQAATVDVVVAKASLDLRFPKPTLSFHGCSTTRDNIKCNTTGSSV
jgi:hypothetical protein